MDRTEQICNEERDEEYDKATNVELRASKMTMRSINGKDKQAKGNTFSGELDIAGEGGKHHKKGRNLQNTPSWGLVGW